MPNRPEDHNARSIQLELDSSDGLHAVWDYPRKLVRYRRSIDGGESWSESITIDQVGDDGRALLVHPLLAGSIVRLGLRHDSLGPGR